ncbi:MAG: peptidase domain-containing ABC transporter [Prevotellaceae bacterium]|jgi:ATP-binding cassette subfamily B protein|nr:peptidase domain-containing ABC transporter [Prevotellaceae bacterium]
MPKPHCIKQHDITDCGAACLASVAAYYGLQLPIARIRQMASTNKRGTNVLGIVEAAQKIGFLAKGVSALSAENKTKRVESLYKIPKPAIAHVVVKENLHHFVVIYGISKTHVKVMEPALGEMEQRPIAEFVKEWTGYLILLAPNDDFEQDNQKMSVLQRFAFLLHPHRKILLQALFGAVVYTALGLATSIYVQKIVDFVIPDANRNLLNLLSIVMLVVLALSLFVSYVKSLFMLRTGFQIDARLILGYYKHLLRLPQSFFDNMRSGEIISRIGDAVKICTFVNETLVSLLVNVFTVLFAFALMFTYYWKLAVVMLLILPLYSIIYALYNRVNKRVQRKVMEQAAELQAQLVESINTAGTIKRFGIEQHADMRTESRFVRFIRTGFSSSLNALIANTGLEMGARAFTIVLLWAGTYFVLDNVITPGELLSFYALIGYFMQPIGALVNINRTYQDAKIAADRLFEVLDLESESTEENKINITREACGDIEFKNITFSYGAREEVFKKFSITFAKGEVNAVIGESGSGKTTLASLLQNLYPLQSGQIYIGGIDVRHIDNASLRTMVGVVPQRIDLFEGSIMDNIILDDFAPDNARIITLCRSVGLLDFVEKLPFGFNTNVGENGVQLSGGQRQRIAIVRALYRNPEILILDEATSSLDSESERHIKGVVEQLKFEGKTIILIAHRLGTVMNADRIFVLQDGSLAEQGTHKELLAQDGLYVKFWKGQTATKE